MRKKRSFVLFYRVITLVVAVVILFPILWIFSSSITQRDLLFTSPVTYFPVQPTLENYRALFREVDVWGLAANTLIVALLSIVGCLLFSLLAAYSFARYQFRGKNIAYAALVFSAMLPTIMTLIPMFQTYRTLGLTDSHIGLAILYVSNFIPFTMMSFVTFIQQIPYSIEEAADVDGAGLVTKIFRVLLPMIKPAIATMAIINFINAMNEFMIPLVFTNVRAIPLSVGLTLVPRISQYNIPWEKISALSTVMLIPIVLFVLIFERNIMEGLTAGSVKQ